jgi:hypothetical protein
MNSSLSLDVDDEDLFQPGIQPSISASDLLSDFLRESPSQEPSLDLRSPDEELDNIAKLSQTPGIQLKFSDDEDKCYLSTLDSDAVQANKTVQGTTTQRPQRRRSSGERPQRRRSSRNRNSEKSRKEGDATARTPTRRSNNEGGTKMTRKLRPQGELIKQHRRHSSSGISIERRY